MTTSFSISFHDGRHWRIRACDPAAQPIVSALCRAMQCRQDGAGRELLVKIGEHIPLEIIQQGPLICHLPQPTNNDRLAIGMMRLSLVIARLAQRRGGLLLHGALAEYQDAGVLLAGPGTVGKTTASRRLPPPWRSLCDDTTLVVRDAHGRYWAHPWPTWSLFYSQNGLPGPGGSWDVPRAVPLRAVFFLQQSPEDRAAPLNSIQAAAMLMASVEQASRVMAHGLPEPAVQALHLEQLAAVQALAAAVPAFRLQISLTGAFWQEIERALAALPRPSTAAPAASPNAHTHPPNAATEPARIRPTTLIGDGLLRVVYRGPSMNPTLSELDLLEVRPYGRQLPRRGDVIYFQTEADHAPVVHRVVKLQKDRARRTTALRTRGDNNPQQDPDAVRLSAVAGRVVAAQRSQRRRPIAGGWRGRLAGAYARLWRLANARLAGRLHIPYRALARICLFQKLLPARLRPRVLVFKDRYKTYYKLVLGERLIGHYEARQHTWRILRPYRLFVDEAKLPRPPA